MDLSEELCKEYLDFLNNKSQGSSNPIETQLSKGPLTIEGNKFEFSPNGGNNGQIFSDAITAILISDIFHKCRLRYDEEPNAAGDVNNPNSPQLPQNPKDKEFTWWQLALLALAIAIVIPLLLYVFLRCPFGFDKIKPDTVESIWLLFWGDFIGAIASFLVVYQAYSDNKRISKDSELTRKQVAIQSDLLILKDEYDRLEKIVIEANEIYSFKLLLRIHEEVDQYQSCFSPKTLKQPQYVEKVRTKALSLVCSYLSKVDNLSLLMYRFSDNSFAYQKFGSILALSNIFQHDVLSHLRTNLNKSTTNTVDAILLEIRQAIALYDAFHYSCDEALSRLSQNLLEEKRKEINKKQSNLHL